MKIVSSKKSDVYILIYSPLLSLQDLGLDGFEDSFVFDGPLDLAGISTTKSFGNSWQTVK